MSKKRSRRSTKHQFGPSKAEHDQQGVNFFSFVAGMITSLMLIFFVWQQIFPSAAARTTGNGTDPTKSETARFDFDSLVERGDVEELIEALKELNGSPDKSDESLNKRIQLHYRRTVIAQSLLRKPLDKKQRKLAIKSNIDAMELVYAYDFAAKLQHPQIARNLKVTAERFIDDDDRDLAFEARMALLTYDSIEEIKRGIAENIDPDVSPYADRFVAIARQFPDGEQNDEICTNVRELFAYLKKTFEPSVPIAFGERIGETFDQLKSPQSIRVFSEIVDKTTMMSNGFESAVRNRFADRANGIANLVQVCQAMVKNPDAGSTLVRAIENLGNTLEQDQQHSAALEVYQSLKQAASNFNDSDSRAAAIKYADNGIARNQILGQTIQWSGSDVDGKPLSGGDFENSVVLLAIWNASDKEFAKTFSEIASETQTLRNAGCKLLAIADGADSTVIAQQAMAEFPKFRFVFGDPEQDGKNSILHQFPSQRFPRLVLLDKEGTVVGFNFRTSDIKIEVESLLSQD